MLCAMFFFLFGRSVARSFVRSFVVSFLHIFVYLASDWTYSYRHRHCSTPLLWINHTYNDTHETYIHVHCHDMHTASIHTYTHTTTYSQYNQTNIRNERVRSFKTQVIDICRNVAQTSWLSYVHFGSNTFGI